MSTVPSGIPLDTAAIMSSVLEGILYGFSVLMFIGFVWTFTDKKSVRDVNRPIAAVAALLLVLSTAHIVIGIIHLEAGLVQYRDTYPGGPMAFFADFHRGTFVAKNAIYTLQTLLGDGVVIYRCYVVWQSVWIIILPCIMWCGVGAFGVCSVYYFSQATTSDIENFFNSEPGHWVATFLAFTLATNVLSTGLLAYRIWMIEREVSAVCATRTKVPILRVLIDAAILYSAALCSSLMCFAFGNNGLYVMGDMSVPIVSITFYMVFIRIATNRNNQHYIPAVSGGTTDTERSNSRQYPMQPLHGAYKQTDVSFMVDSPKMALV
ncbi:hypothetical protein DEU56DRAFT_735068 [Suillus clintonianus]|uniref:uncharacterized protein n=1 Tax=Suillus clintonianus TaxID=1904413 RepID=UPI001B872B49|nr:uncharacterized protein DEU56DRAFT_735068 [Suillus clintonianus]KAG2140175.1 hypothetical protein DEU56DRAFT_735068 [Suillus clintonianus]